MQRTLGPVEKEPSDSVVGSWAWPELGCPCLAKGGLTGKWWRQCSYYGYQEWDVRWDPAFRKGGHPGIPPGVRVVVQSMG